MLEKLKSLKLGNLALMVLALLIFETILISQLKLAEVEMENKFSQELQEIKNSVKDHPLGAVTGPELPNPNCQAGVCTKTVVQTFIDVSTTIISIPSPFVRVTSTGAGSEKILYTDAGGQAWTSQTTTVDITVLSITGPATTSFQLACGAFTGPTASLPLTRTIVSTTAALPGDTIPTSTTGVIENNVSSAQGAAFSAGTTQKIMLGADAPWLVCVVNGVNNAAFTNADNTFAGKFSARLRALAR